MEVLIRKEFNQVTVNGNTLQYDFDLENNMPKSAEEVRWNGSVGTVIRKNGNVDEISDLSEFQTLVDLYQANKNWVSWPTAKGNKNSEIHSGFNVEMSTPFAFSGHEINPSYENWSYLMHLINGAEMFGKNTVDFWDWYDTERSLPLSTAKDLLKKLMVNYVDLDKKKRSMLKEIEAVNDDDFTALNAITW